MHLRAVAVLILAIGCSRPEAGQSRPTFRDASGSRPSDALAQGVPGGQATEGRRALLAERVASSVVLDLVFEEQVKSFALDWLAHAGEPVDIEFGLAALMATEFPTSPKDENHEKFVQSAVRLAVAQSGMAVGLAKSQSYLRAALKNRIEAARKETAETRASREKLEISYRNRLGADDFSEVGRLAAMMPKEYDDARTALRQGVIQLLTEDADLLQSLSPFVDSSADLDALRSQNRKQFDAARKSRK